MLNAVEFKAKIKQGIIEIPEEYQQDLREDSEVQVIVIKQTTTRTNSELKNQEIIDDFTMVSCFFASAIFVLKSLSSVAPRYNHQSAVRIAVIYQQLEIGNLLFQKNIVPAGDR